jgi:2-polyprenyl-6-methoxyphenol hydroxylase-like FAD-dependent oxidoreductase
MERRVRAGPTRWCKKAKGIHALVIGGSLGGLLAARVLADHCRQVTVLERDAFPPLGEHRKGVPQDRHVHGLLASGSQVLERWFPGISQELTGAGALAGDVVADGRRFFEGACLARFKAALRAF